MFIYTMPFVERKTNKKLFSFHFIMPVPDHPLFPAQIPDPGLAGCSLAWLLLLPSFAHAFARLPNCIPCGFRKNPKIRYMSVVVRPFTLQSSSSSASLKIIKNYMHLFCIRFLWRKKFFTGYFDG